MKYVLRTNYWHDNAIVPAGEVVEFADEKLVKELLERGTIQAVGDTTGNVGEEASAQPPLDGTQSQNEQTLQGIQPQSNQPTEVQLQKDFAATSVNSEASTENKV